jgi:hypothetical protein
MYIWLVSHRYYSRLKYEMRIKLLGSMMGPSSRLKLGSDQLDLTVY